MENTGRRGRQGDRKTYRGDTGGEHADMKIEERYRKGKDDMKSGERGHETWRCYVSHTYFIDIVYMFYVYLTYVI